MFVDELMVCHEKDQDIEHQKKLMNKKYALTDEGNLDHYLGVNFEYPDDMNLVMYQRVYAESFRKIQSERC